MKILMFLTLIVCLSGCINKWVEDYEWVKAEEICSEHGGAAKVRARLDPSANLYVICEDGSIIGVDISSGSK